MTAFWTPERLDALTTLRVQGKSFSEIAAILGCSRDAAIGKHHRLMVKAGHQVTPRKSILEDIAGDRLPPEALRNTVVYRAYNPTTPVPEVPKVGVGMILKPLPPKDEPRGPAIGILDVTGCRWPVGDGAGVIGSHAFCNAAKDGHRSYCRHHAQLAFDKVPKPAVAPKSIGAFGLRFGKAAA